MSRTLFGLVCVAAWTSGCVTAADLRFLGMDDRPRDTVVEPTRQPLVLQVEPAPGEPGPGATGGPLAPTPGPAVAYTEPSGFWNSPWVRPLQFGLPSDDPADAIWSVTGAGRGGFGLPADPRPTERLTFGDDDAPPKPVPTKSPKK